VLCFTGSCSLTLRSWGFADFADYSAVFTGYLQAGGVTLIDYTRSRISWNNDIRGFNTAVIQLQTCTATNPRSFDTCAYNEAADSLATYLRGLPSGTVITGVTIDEASAALTNNARNALLAIGVNTAQLQYRGKLTFVATIGQPLLTRVSIAAASGPNLVMNAVVPCTYIHTHVIVSIIVCFQLFNIIHFNGVNM